MTRWQEKFTEALSNPAAIIAAASYTFVVDQKYINEFGKANKLTITNISTENILISIDGLATHTYAMGVGTFGITPEDGIEFKTIKITNLDAAAQIEIGELLGSWGRSDPVGE